MIRSYALALLIGFGLLASSQARAEDMIPAKTLTATSDAAIIQDLKGVAASTKPTSQSAAYPLIRLTPDKLEIVRFDEDAISVLVGNPKHLNMVLDTPRTAILIPREPGSTSFTVLNSKGEVIMERHVIIASPKQDYIRVRRSCVNDPTSNSCKEYSVFFCPDMCHKVAVQQDIDTSKATDIPDIAPSAPIVSEIPEQAVSDAPVQDTSLPPPPPSIEPAPDTNTQTQ